MAKAKSGGGASRRSGAKQTKALPKSQRKVVRQASRQARKGTLAPTRGAQAAAPRAGASFASALSPAIQQRLQQMQASRGMGGRQLGAPGQPMQGAGGPGFGGGFAGLGRQLAQNPAALGALRQAFAQRMGGQGFGVGGVPPGFQGRVPFGGSIPGNPNFNPAGGTNTGIAGPAGMFGQAGMGGSGMSQTASPQQAQQAQAQGMVDQDPNTPGFQFTPQHLQTIGQIALAGTPLAGTFGPAAQKGAAMRQGGMGQQGQPLIPRPQVNPQMLQALQQRLGAARSGTQPFNPNRGMAIPGSMGGFGGVMGGPRNQPTGQPVPAMTPQRQPGAGMGNFGRQLGASLRRGI